MRAWAFISVGTVFLWGCTAAPMSACCETCPDEGDVRPPRTEVEAPEEEAQEEEPIDLDAHLDDCDAAEPVWCLEVWQASAGKARMEYGHSGSNVILDAGPAAHRMCLDAAFPFYAGSQVQDGFIDPGVIDEGLVLEPYEGVILTAQEDWWCVDEDQPTRARADLDFLGESLPPRLAELVHPDRDEDADGTPDRHQLVDVDPVVTKAQLDIWRTLDRESVLSIGKTAQAAAGRVEVQVTSRNLGYVSGTWTIVDTVPAGFSLADVRPAPSERIGSVETGWRLTWGGETRSRAVAAIRYDLVPSIPVDRVYIELDPAMLRADGSLSESLPAAVYDLDIDGDGEIDCR